MKKNIFTGALVLSVGAVLAKVFSAIYRIVLTRILGGVGIGLYQLIFPIYSLCVVLATSGIPMAVSKVVAKNPTRQHAILKKSLLFVSIISLTLTFLLLIGSKLLAKIQGEESISICYIILAPTLILVGVSSVLRGYFQGRENFYPTAISNIIEQLIKLVVGLNLSLVLLDRGIIYAVIGAVVGIVVSEVFSVLVLWICFVKNKHKESQIQAKLELKALLKDILPIVAVNVILPVATFVDSVLVVNLLGINFTSKMSVFLYGLESGAVNSLATLPTLFSFSLASVVLPAISTSKPNFNNSLKLAVALRIVLAIAVPCVVCFAFIPDRLIGLLYGERLTTYGVEGLNIAYRLLALSGLGVVFLAVNQVYSSCLQAVVKRFVTIRNLLIGVGCKYVVELIFLPSVLVNIYALAIANSLCYIVTFALNRMEIKKSFSLRFDFSFAGKLALANSVMLLVLVSVLSFASTWQNTLLAVCVAGIVYLICLWVLKIFNKRELAMIKYKVK